MSTDSSDTSTRCRSSRPGSSTSTLRLGKTPALPVSIIKTVVSIGSSRLNPPSPFSNSIRALRRWKTHLCTSVCPSCCKNTEQTGFVKLEKQHHHLEDSQRSKIATRRTQHDSHGILILKHITIEQILEARRADEQHVQRDNLYNRRLYDQPGISSHDRL